jgi:short-subunit dehydrogenase involved in D-alanine esterification of teichoic acids
MNKNPFDLTGRRALITGASRGIGFALAQGLAAAGAGVAINGRDRDRLAKAGADLRRDGAAVFEAPFDVTERVEVEAGVAAIDAEFGPLDRAMEHGQLMPQSQILGGQCGTTGQKTSNEQPDYLKNAHPWTSVTELNRRILPPMTLHGNRRKSFP